MFQKARIKLTIIYVSIMLLISLSFSSLVYLGITNAAQRALRSQRLREQTHPEFRLKPNQLTPQFGAMLNRQDLDQETLKEIQSGFLISLAYINLVIAGVTGILGYVLTGYTLKPIQLMFEDQERFISDATHELKTPLTSIKTEIEVNLRDKNLSLEQSKDILKSNLEEIDKLKLLINNLIEESKYSKNNTLDGKYDRNLFENINLRLIAEKCISEYRKSLENKKLSIKTKLEDINIKGEKSDFYKLFSIFIDNAIKYSPQSKNIYVKIWKEDNLIKIYFEDEGIGIDEKDLQNIFKRFYRSDLSRNKSKYEGFGLGLSIASGIVQKYKGKIEVKSKINSGSTFIISIPLL